ncbi:MAG: cobalamin-binding protein [Elusimicrobia bacterium]|nr:cobalamin-binding protein [Elusimicrobiota bacterium]
MRVIFTLAMLLCCGPCRAAQSIVSLLPSNTEILYAIGAGPLAGVSNFCDYPPETASVPKLGDLLAPNVEKIALMKPDLVLGGQNKTATAARLRKMGVNFIAIPDAATLADLEKNIILIGKLSGRERRALELAEQIRREIAALKPEPGKKIPSVYVEADQSLWTAGGRSYISDIVEKAGGRNIFADENKSYFKASWESIVARNPDYILVLSRAKTDYSALPMSAEVNAVRNGRILPVPDANIYLRPSPRAVLAIRELAGLLNEKR